MPYTINKHCLYIFSRKSSRRLIPIHPFLWSKSFPEWFAFNRKYVYLLNCGFRKAKSWIWTWWFVLNRNRMVLSKSNEWQAAHSFYRFSWSDPATETSHFLLTLNFTKCSYCVHFHRKYILFQTYCILSLVHIWKVCIHFIQTQHAVYLHDHQGSVYSSTFFISGFALLCCIAILKLEVGSMVVHTF